MAVRFAWVAAIAALLVGIITIPVLMTMPSPLMLCNLSPPFLCNVGQPTGRQYVEGDSPAAVTWLLTSFVVAPLASLLAVWLVGRGHLRRGRIVGALAILPNLLLFAGTYAVMPFHPIVFGLTLATFVALLRARPRERAVLLTPYRRALALAAVVILGLALGVVASYALRTERPGVLATPVATTAVSAPSPPLRSCAAPGGAATAADAESLGELSFVDAQHGWVVALGGGGWSLLRTSDGGARWTRFPLTDLIDVREMRFADACHGWLVVTTPSKTVSLRATADGGATWREQLSRRNGSSAGVPTAIKGLQVIDPTHGAVIAETEGCTVADCPAELLVTADAGAHWTKVYGAAHLALARFVDAGHGWIVTSGAAFGPGNLFATSDGGTTWSARTLPAFAEALTFVDATTGWALGRDGAYCTASFCNRWYLYGTHDGGVTWSTLQDAPQSGTTAWWLPNPKASLAGFLSGPVFIDASTGWIGLQVGAGGAGQRIGGIIATTDGGRTWQESGIDPYPTDVSSFAFIDARTGWADGRSPIKRGPAELFRTTDGGSTWQRQLPNNLASSTRTAVLERFSRITSVIRRIDRIDAKLLTRGDFEKASDPGHTSTSPTADPSQVIWVVAISGEVVPQLGRGSVFPWGIYLVAADSGDIIGMLAGAGPWPSYFDGLPDRDRR